MSTDVTEGRDRLNDRLEAADRSRHRRTWLAAAAAVVGIGVAAVVVSNIVPRGDSGPPATTVSPSPSSVAVTQSFSSTTFGVPLTLNLPRWVTESLTEPAAESPDRLTWNRCDTDSTCIGLSFDVFTHYFAPGATVKTPIADYAGYVAYLQSLSDTGYLSVSDVSTTTIGGRPATLLTVTAGVGGSEDSALGCYAKGQRGTEECWGFGESYPTRLAIVDTGDQPLVILTRTATDNPDAADWTAQVESMLPTIRFS